MIRKAVDGKALGLMSFLCMIWGLQQVSIKLAADDIATVMQIALRSGIAALLLAGLMLWRKDGFSLQHTWKPGLLAGLLFSAEFFLIAEGLRLTSASHISVLLYSAPIFAALGLHLTLPTERLNRLQWSGIGLAFIGIVITFLGRDSAATNNALPSVIIGDLLGLLAGLSWGATTVIIRNSSLSTAPAGQTLMYQLIACFVLVLTYAVITDTTMINLTPNAITQLLFQSVVICFFSYLTWFWLLKKYMASQLGVFSFMSPLFGVLFGVVILNEPLEQNFMLGALLVMTGIVLVSGASAIKRWASGR